MVLGPRGRELLRLVLLVWERPLQGQVRMEASQGWVHLWELLEEQAQRYPVKLCF